jgi:hypothetical protein
MAIVKTPDRTYALGEKGLPSLGQKVVSWPWGGTPHLTSWSLDALKYPLGTIIIDTLDGHPIIAQIQTHDTYGAHPEWGVKLHKGTSVFVPVAVDGVSGKEIAMRDPPDGWGVSPIGAAWHDNRGRRYSHPWGQHDPFVQGAQYLHQPALTPTPTTATPQQMTVSQGDTHMSWRDEWRGRFTKIPKLAVLAGTTVAGLAIVGTPVGAIAGLVAGLFVDKELRGGPFLSGFHGDFGIGTIIPALGATKAYILTDVGTGSQHGLQTQVTGKSLSDAAGNALKQYYPSATTVVALPGTDTFQTDRGDTFKLDLQSSFNGEGTWKVYRYSPTEGSFHYLAMVNAGSEGSAMDEATSQVFSATAAKPYSLPGFTNVYITNNGDVFRLGMES